MIEKKQPDPLIKYCFLRYNPRLRQTIAYRIKQRGFPLATIANKYGIRIDSLKRFLNSDDPKDWRKISQWAVIRVCNELGIELELTMTIKENAPNDFIRKRDAKL